MSTLKYIIEKYNLGFGGKLPVEIPNVGKKNLAVWLAELGFKIGVEVGVAAGEYSYVLCKNNYNMKLYGVDPWKPYKGYSDYTRTATFKLLYNNAKKRLSIFPNYEFIEEFSMDAIKRFKDNSLDFVYIDANHRNPYVTQDITEWYKKVKTGGILAGHDYMYHANIVCDVPDSVKKFTRDNDINPWFVLGTNAKVPGIIRDDIRSWMIIK